MMRCGYKVRTRLLSWNIGLGLSKSPANDIIFTIVNHLIVIVLTPLDHSLSLFTYSFFQS